MKLADQDKYWIVYLSTFPPRQCGIATFSTDLTKAIDQLFGESIKSKVVAMNLTQVHHFPYSKKVIGMISQPCEEDYIKMAGKLNRLKKVKLVNIQHEFGIFGGENGSYLLKFLKKLKKPVVTTLHTVVPKPDKKMLQIVREISQDSKGIIVMTHSSKNILIKDYQLDPVGIKVIPHGIHQVPFKDSAQAKADLGLAGKIILSTFGFLSPNKGIEYVIEALPKVVTKFPEVKFLVAGVTHPVILDQNGETYRNSLIKKVHQLGLSNYVSFYNTYFDIKKLLRFLEATDIYIAPSLNKDQTVSGTLSYALGSGRAVISTAFAQAKQDVTKEVGILVDFKKSEVFTRAIIKLIGDRKLQAQMGKNAYFRTRHMTWENVAQAYMKYFSIFAPDLILERKKLPTIKLEHLISLTDDFGIIQFAKLTKPDISSGYTIDDNARALIATTQYCKKIMSKRVLQLMAIYLNFIKLVARADGYFDNYVNSDRKINKARNIREKSEDANARALYALALVMTTKQIPNNLREQARSLWEHSFNKKVTFSSPRAIAFYIKALSCLGAFAEIKTYCNQLVSLYEKSRSIDWEWFEPYLTYSNATLIEAMLLGYKITGEKKYLEVAEKTLSFLVKNTFNDDTYMPIGQSGWFFKGEKRQYFDQQPEDVTATVETLNTMFKISKKENYKKLAKIAFNWFLGDNVLGQVVYDRTTGGCYDGIGKKFINLNQGAESTISYLIARLSFENKN